MLGLATGRTMERVYDRLAAMDLDFSRCRTFNLDEYIGVPAEDKHSYRHYMDEHLFSRVNIARANTHMPDGMAADLGAEAARYERLIRRGGRHRSATARDRRGRPYRLQRAAVGAHVAHPQKALTPITRQQNAAMFGGDADRVPARALTMGVGTILEARELLLLATGPAKAAILAKAVEGPITAMISASALQLHPCCKVVVDEPRRAR